MWKNPADGKSLIIMRKGEAMGNTIKRNTIFIEAMAMKDNAAFGAGEAVTIFKFEEKWITRDANGKFWRLPISLLRNEHLFTVNKQYSMSDIIYYLMKKNQDYQTVAWEFLEDAVNTTFAEANLYGCGLDGICKYVTENLI